MKRIQQLFPVILMLFTCHCHREKCDEFSGKVLSGKMETYFGAFKAGNWWVYQNQNGAKLDSIYLAGFTDSIIKQEVNCTVYELRKFSLHNAFLANLNDIAVRYDATETSITFKMEAPNTSLPSFIFGFTDSLVRSLPAADNPGNNRLDSVRLNGVSYYNILTGKKTPNTYYFGKDRGLVGWITTTDTFNLVRFRIL